MSILIHKLNGDPAAVEVLSRASGRAKAWFSYGRTTTLVRYLPSSEVLSTHVKEGKALLLSKTRPPKEQMGLVDWLSGKEIVDNRGKKVIVTSSALYHRRNLEFYSSWAWIYVSVEDNVWLGNEAIIFEKAEDDSRGSILKIIRGDICRQLVWSGTTGADTENAYRLRVMGRVLALATTLPKGSKVIDLGKVKR